MTLNPITMIKNSIAKTVIKRVFSEVSPKEALLGILKSIDSISYDTKSGEAKITMKKEF